MVTGCARKAFHEIHRADDSLHGSREVCEAEVIVGYAFTTLQEGGLNNLLMSSSFGATWIEEGVIDVKWAKGD